MKTGSRMRLRFWDGKRSWEGQRFWEGQRSLEGQRSWEGQRFGKVIDIRKVRDFEMSATLDAKHLSLPAIVVWSVIDIFSYCYST